MVANKIRVKCAEAGISQAELSRRLQDVNEVGMTFVATGRVMPTKSDLAEMCKVLKCEALDLYAEDDLDLLGCGGGRSEQVDDLAEVKAELDEIVKREGSEKRGHDGQIEFRSWMQEQERNRLSAAIKALGYRSEAEWLRDMYRRTVEAYAGIKAKFNGV